MTGPVIVEVTDPPPLQAFLVTAENVREVAEWADCGYWGRPGPPTVWLRNAEGEPVVMAKPGQWVIRGCTGKFFAVDAEFFDANYRQVES